MKHGCGVGNEGRKNGWRQEECAAQWRPMVTSIPGLVAFFHACQHALSLPTRIPLSRLHLRTASRPGDTIFYRP